jgi:hypothetical protein
VDARRVGAHWAALVHTLRAISEQQLGLTEGCEKVVALRWLLGQTENDLFIPFVGVDSELHIFPTGLARANWSAEGLAREDAKRMRVEEHYRQMILTAIETLLPFAENRLRSMVEADPNLKWQSVVRRKRGAQFGSIARSGGRIDVPGDRRTLWRRRFHMSHRDGHQILRVAKLIRNVSLTLTVCALIAACLSTEQKESNASFAEMVTKSGTVRLAGWAKLSGELEIYADRASFDRAARFPNCISGVFSDQYERNLSAYDGKRVAVTGELFNYSNLPYEDRPAIPRRMLSDSVIINMCFGRNVLLIKNIQIAP